MSKPKFCLLRIFKRIHYQMKMNKKNTFFTLYILGLSFIITSCYYGNEEDLFANIECRTEDLSYQQNIRPIIANNCLVCHSAAANLGNVNLQNYEDLIPYINDGSLLGSIKHEPGFAPMPENSTKIDECSISQIEGWIDEGFPNN